MLVAVLTTAFCLLIGNSSRLVRSWRTPWTIPKPAPLTPEGKQAALREAVGYLVAAGVPLVGRSTRHRMRRKIQILLARILLLHPAPWQTVLVIAACQFGAGLFIARQYVLAQIFVTPLALISTLLAAPTALETLPRDRIVETVIGTAVGIAVVVAPAAWRRMRAGAMEQHLSN
jgi:hypothetical protein